MAVFLPSVLYKSRQGGTAVVMPSFWLKWMLIKNFIKHLNSANKADSKAQEAKAWNKRDSEGWLEEKHTQSHFEVVCHQPHHKFNNFLNV